MPTAAFLRSIPNIWNTFKTEPLSPQFGFWCLHMIKNCFPEDFCCSYTQIGSCNFFNTFCYSPSNQKFLPQNYQSFRSEINLQMILGPKNSLILSPSSHKWDKLERSYNVSLFTFEDIIISSTINGSFFLSNQIICCQIILNFFFLIQNLN